MYIEPNSTIKLYNDIPLTPDYNDTIYFEDRGHQTGYFHNGREKYRLSVQSYQRVNSGIMRIEKKADDIYDCNYLAFQNTNFGNKWFYAFITKVEYVNNKTSEITYVIDDIQTWLLDTELKECFVEREHSESDNVGENLVDENIDIGYYVTNKRKTTDFLKAYSVVIATSYDPDAGGDVQGQMSQRIYSGLKLVRFDVLQEDGTIDNQEVQRLNDWIRRIGDSSTAIASMIYMPTSIFGWSSTIGRYFETYSKTELCTNLDEYVPKNKKLFNYPYNLLYVHNGNNDGVNYRIEELANYNYEYSDKLVFELISSPTGTGEVLCFPLYYLGVVENTQFCVDLGKFPQCAFTTNAYLQYLALNGNKEATKTLGNYLTTLGGGVALSSLLTGGSASGLAIAGAVGTIVSGVMGEVNHQAELADIGNRPASIKGTQGSEVFINHLKRNFYFEHRTISKEYAERIDNYFSAYGYACKKIKKPNIHVRENWTYTKTVGCIIVPKGGEGGGAPASAIKNLCKIFDKGIRFWSVGINLGNFSINNRPLLDVQSQD